MTMKFTPYDPVDDLTTKESIEVFMQDAISTRNEEYIKKAEEVVEKAREKIAKNLNKKIISGIS